MSPQYSQTQPSAGLSNYVQAYWRFSHNFASGEPKIVYPDTYYELIWVHKGQLLVDGKQAPRLFLGGFSEKPIAISSREAIELWGTRFHAWGLIPLCDPSNITRQAFTSAEQVLGKDASDQLAAILSEATHPTFMTAIESFLLKRQDAEFLLDSRHLALSLGFGDDNVSKVHEIAKKYQLSSRQLTRTISKMTGKTPKELMMRIRFERARRRLISTDSLTRVALDCGYSDQSHLINEFKRLAHTTPSQYRKSIAAELGL